MPSTMDSWLNDTRRPRIRLGAISAMYSGDNMEAMPTPTPHRMRYRMKGVSAAWAHAADGTQAEFGISGARRRNQEQAPATSMPPLRPMAFDTQPATMAPMMQPNSALETVQPDKLLRAVSERCCGSMKFASIDVTAPGYDSGVVAEQQAAQSRYKRHARY
jgi:hypothetical protein